MYQKSTLILCLIIAFNCIVAEERWAWKDSNNRRERAFNENNKLAQNNKANDKYRSELYGRIEREREPTTKRPLPGELQNDDIDDDEYANTNVGTRNYPYIPGNFNAGQVTGYGGGYPNLGGGFAGSPGILVGPGGPTGVIGRPPQHPYTGGSGYQPGFVGGIGGFGGAQPGLGYPGAQANAYGGGLNAFQGYPTQGGYPGAQIGAQYPGAQYPIGSQYPNGQFGSGQYPGTQFAGAQYPVGQFPGGSPQYTEGYGLAYTNGQQPHAYGNGLYPGQFGFNAGYGDEYKRNALVEGKTAKIESRKVDDKVSNDLKKV